MTQPTRTGIQRFWLGLALLTGMLLLWVSQTVRCTQLSYQIQSVEQEYKKEQRKRAELELQRDRCLSLETIETIARQRYGLVNPQKESVILLALAE